MDSEGPARVPDNVIDELKGREHKGIIALPKAARERLASQAVERAAESLRGSVNGFPRKVAMPYRAAAAGLPVPNTMTFAPIGVRL